MVTASFEPAPWMNWVRRLMAACICFTAGSSSAVLEASSIFFCKENNHRKNYGIFTFCKETRLVEPQAHPAGY